MLAKPKDFHNFECRDGLIFIKFEDCEFLCIPSYVHKGRSIKEIVIDEAHSLLAHLESRKMLAYLQDHVWWKSMAKDVDSFCNSCTTCKRTKTNNQRLYGMLHPLKPPTYPWETIRIDFMDFLLESKDRDGAYDMLTVIINHLTGMVHLVLSHMNYKAKEVAELVFSEVYKYHGLPKKIVSDRDTLFTSIFWSHLHALIGTKLKMSSAYHPKTDGLTEQSNRTVGAMLRQCISVDQKDWVSRLPAIEFAINCTQSEMTGYAPFFLNTGRMPHSMIWNSPAKTEYLGVKVFAQRMKLAVISAHDSILNARVKQTRDANQKRRPVPFANGDLVYLSTKNISFPKGLAQKLVPKYMGPYHILKDFVNSSFLVDLPLSLKSRGIHNVFHSSLLQIHIPNDDRLFPGRAENKVGMSEESSSEWAVKQIIRHSGSKTEALFQVKWKSGDVTWLPYEYFDMLGIENISQLRDSRIPAPGDDDSNTDNVAEVRMNVLEISPSQLSKPLRHHFKKWMPETFPTLTSRLPIPLLDSPSIMAPTYSTTKYNKDGTIAFEGITHKGNSIWEFTMGDSLNVYIMTDDEINMTVEFSCMIHFGEYYSGVTPIPTAYSVFADIVNLSEYSYNACEVPDSNLTIKPHSEALNIKYFFPADNPFFTESTKDCIIAATAEAHAWTLTALGMMGKSMTAAKVKMHNLHHAAQLRAKFEAEHDERRAENELKDVVLGLQPAKGTKRDCDKGDTGQSSKKQKLDNGKGKGATNRRCPKGFFKVFGLDKAKKALEESDVAPMVEDVAPAGAKAN